MNSETLLEYLQNYVRTPEILSLDMIQDVSEALPACWIDILSVNGKERCKRALGYWINFESEFKGLVEYLKNHLVSIDLVHYDSQYCLIYGVQSSDNSRVLYYEARNPNSKVMNSEVFEVWSNVPDKLKLFYDEFHNGWYYLASRSMGLSSVEDMFVLNEEEWGILDDIEEPMVDLSNTIAVFSNGMGDYICLEHKAEVVTALLWKTHEAPRLNIEFWPVIDAWIVLGFES